MLKKATTTYLCEKCGGEFNTVEEAKRCEAMGIEELKVKVGDFCLFEWEEKGFWRTKRKSRKVQVVGIEGPFGFGENFKSALDLSCTSMWCRYPVPLTEHTYLIWIRFEHFDVPIESVLRRIGVDFCGVAFYPNKYHQSQLKPIQ